MLDWLLQELQIFTSPYPPTRLQDAQRPCHLSDCVSCVTSSDQRDVSTCEAEA